MRNNRITKLIDTIYDELYKKAKSIDGKMWTFQELKDNAIAYPSGNKKFFPFMAFYISDEEFNEIVNNHLKYKRAYTKQMVEFNVYLGASPTSSLENWEKLKERYEMLKDESDWENISYDEVKKQVDGDRHLAEALIFFSKYNNKN